MALPQAGPMTMVATTPATDGQAGGTRAAGGSGGGELLTDVGALAIAAGLVGVVVLVRRWLMLRSRQPLPGLPKERVLPLSRHGALHDPKYLGRILEAEEPPTGP
ncbi:hypothetical protein [Synechococcus sp. CCAP 1479/9]|uniref:hypothetical protein n=1 Tax=Synechococcus sp. CCAP 1479/9 TaxID=1221593 RepID=UPI001C23D4B1|nr:hypothetical protein [Synechococcus sp. CCAP 1479/9]